MSTELARNNRNGIDIFGGREEIKEIAERLAKMMPGAQKFTPAEALTVAQLAVAHGLDPFNGEIWGIKGNNGKWYGVMVGIKGLRRAAQKQIHPGNYWTQFIKQDPKEYGYTEKHKVYECLLRDTVLYDAWAQALSAVMKAGVPYKDAVVLVGTSPITIGVGIVKPGEPSKMDLTQLAKKRAEADALKQRFSIDFRGTQYVDEDVSPFDKVDTPVIEAEIRNPEELIEELGYGPTSTKQAELITE